MDSTHNSQAGIAQDGVGCVLSLDRIHFALCASEMSTPLQAGGSYVLKGTWMVGFGCSGWIEAMFPIDIY